MMHNDSASTGALWKKETFLIQRQKYRWTETKETQETDMANSRNFSYILNTQKRNNLDSDCIW